MQLREAQLLQGLRSPSC